MLLLLSGSSKLTVPMSLWNWVLTRAFPIFVSASKSTAWGSNQIAPQLTRGRAMCMRDFMAARCLTHSRHITTITMPVSRNCCARLSTKLSGTSPTARLICCISMAGTNTTTFVTIMRCGNENYPIEPLFCFTTRKLERGDLGFFDFGKRFAPNIPILNSNTATASGFWGSAKRIERPIFCCSERLRTAK